jgi:hypothetical protein
MGRNVGEGYYRTPAGAVEPIPTDRHPLTRVRVVLKATGGAPVATPAGPQVRDYIIHSAYPMAPSL